MSTVYVTGPREEMGELAAELVERRLAACVNRVDCRSTYRWDGEVVDDAESILFAKTTDEAYPDLKAAIVEEHPHDVPCIERFDEDDVLDAFDEWIGESVEP